jgi:CBS domain containing-hemolysin-like protein
MIVMVVLLLFVLVLLLLVAGAAPRQSEMSAFEKKRRLAMRDAAALAVERRENLLGDVTSLQRALVALFLVIFALLSAITFGWFLGILLAVIISLEYGVLARYLQKWSQPLYEKYEMSLLGFVEKHQGIFRLLRSVTPESAKEVRLESRDELLYLIERAGGLLSIDEKKLFAHGLAFQDKLVRDIMTPRGVIDSISKKELLGPLVLDGLHKTGHTRFPVIDGDIDHIIGVLHIQDLFTLDAKRSVTVEKAMEPRVFYVREDQSLQRALAAFLRTHHHLFVVVDGFRETVGVLSLEDVIEALLGRKIIDEFDAHDDLRAVAEHNPRGNNTPKQSEDV